jgi:biopolymer transport protein ExbD
MSDSAARPQVDEEAVEPVLMRRRKLEEADMDITPMIDMTFLLLIFFIVTSKMGPKAGIELPPAKHGTAAVEKNNVILTIGPGDPIAQVYRGESLDPADAFASGSAEDQENEVITYIESEINKSGGSKTGVLVQAAKGLKHREVARIAKAAGRADVENLFVGIVEKKD